MKRFLKGITQGIPIALGYLSVSFGFGIMAVQSGLSVKDAVLISLTNLTSAGQAAGVGIIAAGGSLIEMAVVQLVINIRYSLMAISLSQKTDEKFTLPHRLLAGYGITDEIFAVCYAETDNLVPQFMYGVILIAAIGWVAGTFLGAAMGEILPPRLSAALGIMLYGMFCAIIVPPSKKQRDVLFTVILAAVLNIFIRMIPIISDSLAVIISALISAALAALIFKGEEEEE
ncbi:MAG: AzlC family ABC transporter permease [Oscillospiraceae bacterium]|nr:AzlC family ABC transporter permease [Oscillospiraceae bacterium]